MGPKGRQKKDGTQWFYSVPKKKSSPETVTKGGANDKGSVSSGSERSSSNPPEGKSTALAPVGNSKSSSQLPKESVLTEIGEFSADVGSLQAQQPIKVQRMRFLESVPPIPAALLPRPSTNLNIAPRNWLEEDPLYGIHHHIPGYERPRKKAAASLLGIAVGEAKQSQSVVFPPAGTDGAQANPYHLDPNSLQQPQDPQLMNPALHRSNNIITSSAALKQVFTAGHSDDPVMLTVHRVGNALLIDDPPRVLPARSIEEARNQTLLSKVLYEALDMAGSGVLRSPAGEGTSPFGHTSVAERSPVLTPASAPRGNSTPMFPSVSGGGSTALTSTQDSLAADRHVVVASTASRYNSVLRWGFNDLDILLGADIPIIADRNGKTEMTLRVVAAGGEGTEETQPRTKAISGPEGGEVSRQNRRSWAEAALDDDDEDFRLPQAHSPHGQSPPPAATAPGIIPVKLSQREALDAWFDAILTNVRNVALCVHRNGVIQDYKLLPVSDVLTVVGRLEATKAMNFTGSVLQWLDRNCTEEGRSYVLMRRGDSSNLKLYECGPGLKFFDDMSMGIGGDAKETTPPSSAAAAGDGVSPTDGAGLGSTPTSRREEVGSTPPAAAAASPTSSFNSSTADPVIDDFVGLLLLHTAIQFCRDNRTETVQTVQMAERSFKLLLCANRPPDRIKFSHPASRLKRSISSDEEILVQFAHILPKLVTRAAFDLASRTSASKKTPPPQSKQEEESPPRAQSPGVNAEASSRTPDRSVSPARENGQKSNTQAERELDDAVKNWTVLCQTATASSELMKKFTDIAYKSTMSISDKLPAAELAAQAVYLRVLVAIVGSSIRIITFLLEEYHKRFLALADSCAENRALFHDGKEVTNSVKNTITQASSAFWLAIAKFSLGVDDLVRLINRPRVATTASPDAAAEPSNALCGVAVPELDRSLMMIGLHELIGDIVTIGMESQLPLSDQGPLDSHSPFNGINHSDTMLRAFSQVIPDELKDQRGFLLNLLCTALRGNLVEMSFQALRMYSFGNANGTSRFLFKTAAVYQLLGSHYAVNARQTKAMESIARSIELIKASRTSPAATPIFGGSTVLYSAAYLKLKIAFLHKAHAEQFFGATTGNSSTSNRDLTTMSEVFCSGRSPSGGFLPLSEAEDGAWLRSIDSFRDTIREVNAEPVKESPAAKNSPAPERSPSRPANGMHDSTVSVEERDQVLYKAYVGMGSAALAYARRLTSALWRSSLPAGKKDVGRTVEDFLQTVGSSLPAESLTQSHWHERGLPLERLKILSAQLTSMDLGAIGSSPTQQNEKSAKARQWLMEGHKIAQEIERQLSTQSDALEKSPVEPSSLIATLTATGVQLVSSIIAFWALVNGKFIKHLPAEIKANGLSIRFLLKSLIQACTVVKETLDFREVTTADSEGKPSDKGVLGCFLDYLVKGFQTLVLGILGDHVVKSTIAMKAVAKDCLEQILRVSSARSEHSIGYLFKEVEKHFLALHAAMSEMQ